MTEYYILTRTFHDPTAYAPVAGPYASRNAAARDMDIFQRGDIDPKTGMSRGGLSAVVEAVVEDRAFINRWCHPMTDDELDTLIAMNSQHITAAEVAERLGLSESTVRNAINRDDGHDFPSARKSAGTWLLTLHDAMKRWSKFTAMLALAVFLAALIAQLPV